ncbi:hypothetical protein ACFLTZ_03730 [Chloroflexota bacterium]
MLVKLMVRGACPLVALASKSACGGSAQAGKRKVVKRSPTRMRDFR